MDEEPLEAEAEVLPSPFGYGVDAVGRFLQAAHGAIAYIAEVLQHGAQLRAQPERTHLSAVHQVVDKQAAPFLGVVPRTLDDAYQRLVRAVAVDVANLEAIDGIGNGIAVEMVEAVVLFPQTEGARLVVINERKATAGSPSLHPSFGYCASVAGCYGQ